MSSDQKSPLASRRGGPLAGRVRPPGDKSISHRAFLFGLLARGGVEIEGLLEGEDVLRTGEACRQLGAEVVQHGPGRWSVHGPGLGALLEPRTTLDFGNAGTGSRLMMGVVGSHPITATFDGDAHHQARASAGAAEIQRRARLEQGAEAGAVHAPAAGTVLDDTPRPLSSRPRPCATHPRLRASPGLHPAAREQRAVRNRLVAGRPRTAGWAAAPAREGLFLVRCSWLARRVGHS